MGLNKSKKLGKKSVKPEPIVEEVEELDEVEEIEDEEEIEEIEAPKPKRASRSSKKAAKPAPVIEDDDEDEDDSDDVSFDTDSVVKGIVSDKRNLTSAVYQVQLRLPAELEPLYKALSPRLKKSSA